MATTSAASSRRRVLAGIAAGAALPLLPEGAAARAAPRRLAFHHLHTGERLETVYWAEGVYRPGALARINEILRDWRRDEVVPIERELLDVVHSLRARLPGDAPVEVICGYRSPETNAMLRQRSNGVASRSLHLDGRAIDFRLPDCGLARLHREALALGAGGVGYYPSSNFIHVDTGRVRRWGG